MSSSSASASFPSATSPTSRRPTPGAVSWLLSTRSPFRRGVQSSAYGCAVLGPWISSESDRDHLGRTGRGEVSTAANLAISLAQSGRKTLLIDADFRRPSQHRMFGMVKNVGLSNLILGDVTEDDAVKPVDAAHSCGCSPRAQLRPIRLSAWLGANDGADDQAVARVRLRDRRHSTRQRRYRFHDPCSLGQRNHLIVEQGRTMFPRSNTRKGC